ncbi:Rz1-like lysis system protein LysC [Gilliamella apicola]|uniref:Rz1-like lysis system protein LysC n=1 Tax=Gilliamella apicola TaxID=1196095 RepID=UPI003F582173
MIALIVSFLLLCLTACTTERTLYVNQPIPEHLLIDCVPKLPPGQMTFGDSLKYNEHLLNVIEMCNRDKRAIREVNK